MREWIRRRRRAAKYEGEMAYWRSRAAAEEGLRASHYEEFFTNAFGLTRDSFAGKRVLDIGCGPRGSLEWAGAAGLRVGLDPLALRYRELGTAAHQMLYVAGTAEAIPFRDASFEIVSSFNALDHADDVAAAIAEISRVLAPHGTFLLLTDIHPRPTTLEPSAFSWDIADAIPLRCVMQRHFERTRPGIYESVREGVAFDHSVRRPRYGVLMARFTKPG